MYITVDEAITYTDHIRPKLSGIYDFSAANNHLLNTILSKLFSIFSPYSELGIRLPSLIVGGWFFLFYLPSRVHNIAYMIFLASLFLFPYYISEYWSLSRGYFMSGCFSAASLIELEFYMSNDKDARSRFASQFYMGLSLLSSFVMLPMAAVLTATLFWTNSGSFKNRIKGLFDNLSGYFLVASQLIALYAIRSFKTSGEALAYTKDFSILAPIQAVAGALITGNSGYVFIFTVLLVASSLLIIIGRSPKGATILLVVTVSLFAMWLGGSLGTGFPISRSWIPYWFPMCLIASQIFFVIKPTASHITSISVIMFCLACSANNLYWYTPEYAYSWRSNYYQVKSLKYYSSLRSDFCLEERDKGDKVLIFYWDDPKSGVMQPRTCGDGESSPYGFTNFEMPGKVFDIPDKLWGSYPEAKASASHRKQ